MDAVQKASNCIILLTELNFLHTCIDGVQSSTYAVGCRHEGEVGKALYVMRPKTNKHTHALVDGIDFRLCNINLLSEQLLQPSE
jgi:hypothetical protein